MSVDLHTALAAIFATVLQVYLILPQCYSPPRRCRSAILNVVRLKSIADHTESRKRLREQGVSRSEERILYRQESTTGSSEDKVIHRFLLVSDAQLRCKYSPDSKEAAESRRARLVAAIATKCREKISRLMSTLQEDTSVGRDLFPPTCRQASRGEYATDVVRA
jgi:hypothetical protein